VLTPLVCPVGDAGRVTAVSLIPANEVGTVAVRARFAAGYARAREVEVCRREELGRVRVNGHRAGRSAGSLVALVLVAVLALAACGSSKKAASTTTTTTPADGLIQAGLAAGNRGDSAAALADYLAAVNDDPSSNVAYYDLGVIYQREGNTAQARADYQQAIRIDPTYKSALFNLAILDTSTDPTTALSLYKQLLTLNVNDSNVLFNLGLLLRQTGQTVEGNADLARAIKINPALASRVPATSTTTKP